MTDVAKIPPARGWMNAFLDIVERFGNRLPDQITIFAVLAAATLFISWLAASSNLSVVNPITQERIQAYNMLSRDGLQGALTGMVREFAAFPPLGIVLAALLGVGVADKSGLFTAALKALVGAVPRWAVTPTIIFAGLMSHVAADAGYVVLPPLAAMLYASFGRHPIAGVAAAFAGVAGGFSANLLLSSLDPMLAGLTAKAANDFDPSYPPVNAACNWYFMAVSTAFLTLLGWFVSVRWVEPHLGTWGAADVAEKGDSRLTSSEKRGLIAAAVVFVVALIGVALLVVPDGALLRSSDPKLSGVDALRPFFDSLVILILIVFLLPGIAFGIAVGAIRSDADIARMMGASMSTMGAYIAVAFFAAQFLAWFKKSNLGFIIAINGAELLQSIHLTGIPLMIAFVALTAVVNILISSASAKWTIMAPVFVPMLMLLGRSPEATQALYRVGDSVTNIITPLNAYIPILLAVTQRYVPKSGLGTLLAAMLPYSLAFFIGWTALLVVWMTFEWPLGLAAPLHYSPVAR
jgi:aminobenzoyl-glutamate transport protein